MTNKETIEIFYKYYCESEVFCGCGETPNCTDCEIDIAIKSLEKCADYKQKYIDMLIEYDGNLCEKCQNHIECKWDKCPKYQHGKEMTNNNVYHNWYWSCKDFNYGTCDVLKGTPCEGCYDDNCKGFELKEEL